MKSKIFKPLLAPNDQPNLDELKYPLLASYKLDGVRCIFYKGKILSRSLKPIPNKQLNAKFEELRKYSEENNLILDGEIYSPLASFQRIIHYVMTEDLGKEALPAFLKFHMFDVLDETLLEPYEKRLQRAWIINKSFSYVTEHVKHYEVHNKERILELFAFALKDKCEGLMLRDPKALYKFGRGTLKEGIIFKVKPYTTFDAKITGVVQSTEVDPNAEKKINELGRSVTSKKKNDRIAIEKASAFYVDFIGKELKVCLAMTDEQKQEIWKNRDSYIGKFIEFKGMVVGMKDLPRHSVMIRFREDKNGN